MKKGAARQVTRWLVSELNAQTGGNSWVAAGNMAARRSGPWVQSVGTEMSRSIDEFVLWHGLSYLRAWYRVPGITGDLAGGRLKGPMGADEWLAMRRFEADRSAVSHLITSQVRPSIDSPLSDVLAVDLLRARDSTWQQHALCFIAAEAGDRSGARAHLADLTRVANGRPVEDYVAAATRAVEMMDRPAELSAWLDEIQESHLASIKGRPLG